MNPVRTILQASFMVLAFCVTACGDSHGPDFHPIPGVTGKLAYVAPVNRGNSVENQLRVLDLQSGAIRTVYTAPPGLSILGVTWHPDGHSLAISTLVILGDPGNARLLRVNEDGSGVAVPLFDRIGPELAASYSAQGALAYCAGFDPDRGLYVNGISAWPSDCGGDAAPAWLPDESAVAMVAFVGGVFGFYKVDLASKTATAILTIQLPGNVSGADVSPDGSTIAAAVVDATGVWKIQLIPLDGSGSSVLPGTESGDQPQWSADASRIVFVKNFRPYVYELASGGLTRIIDVQMYSAAWLE
jgi:Tol biopolymer transport system component